MPRLQNPFPGVSRQVDRHGKLRWRFRRRPGKDIYLPGTYGSLEFRQAYEAIVAENTQPKPEVRYEVGTISWLITQFLDTTRFRNLSESRRKTLRRELEWLRKEAGSLPFKRMEVRHVEALTKLKEGAVAANTVKKNLSTLFNFAIKKSILGQTTNPARYADKRKVEGEGYHTWSEAEVTQYLAHHPAGSKARLALLIFLCTGAARQDAARMTRVNVVGGRVKYSRGKTKVPANLPILPELAAEIDRLPPEQVHLLAHGKDKPYQPDTLGNWFHDQVLAAGLSECSAHGLRKAGATRLAEAGATDWEIASYLAHKDTKLVAVYVSSPNRGRLGDGAMGRLGPSGMT